MAILRRQCPHCSIEHVAFQVAYSVQKSPHVGYAWNSLAICGACGMPICFLAMPKQQNLNAQPVGHNGDVEQIWHVSSVWPSIEAPGAPQHTPEAVKKRFLEGEDAFRRRNWNSAVAMYRSSLDIATKGMPGVPKGTFFDRLEWLHQNHGITPAIRSWADHVRVEGNAALHEPEEFEESDAKSLRLFTEMFLRYVFELPGEVQKFRAATAPATAAAAQP